MKSPNDPFVSVVIPAYNEEGRLGATLTAWRAHLNVWAVSWEIVVVDDGSIDATSEVVEMHAARDRRIHLVQTAHAGKGAALRHGMLTATGHWRFMADADLSMKPAEIDRFFASRSAESVDVAVGSREATGAQRVGEPLSRHLIGRAYNWLVRLLVVPGIQDTQCGYKLFTAQAAEAVFSTQRLDGFGVDVELLFLATKMGYSVGEVPLTWHYDADSRVNLFNGANAFMDILRVRVNDRLGRYESVRTCTRGVEPKAN